MKIPKYVVEMLERAKYNFTASGENYAAGYTIDIAKYSHYEYAETFKNEINRLVDWVNKEYKKMGGEYGEAAYVLNVPNKTVHRYMQYATVTIFDPIMQYIEKYIKE